MEFKAKILAIFVFGIFSLIHFGVGAVFSFAQTENKSTVVHVENFQQHNAVQDKIIENPLSVYESKAIHVAAQESDQVQDTHTHGHGHFNLGEVLPLWSCIPFACILLSIALFPLLAPEFWHHHFGKISAFWAATLGIPFLIAYRSLALYEIFHIILADYVPFIILL
jgi:hypothetical protein